MNENSSAALQPDTSLPRLKMSEIGQVGLRTAGKQVVEELDKKFRFPELLITVEDMKKNPTLAAGLHLYRMMLGRVGWRVEVPVGASDVTKERAKFLTTCMSDMTHSWEDFINEVVSYLEYGFSVHEIVWKRRKASNSKYTDNLVGWAKLPIRSQSTISGWIWSEDGRQLLGVEQDPRLFADKNRFANISGKYFIPTQYMLHFTSDQSRQNPFGTSVLKSCYRPYRLITLTEESESVGIARDLQGVPVVGLPPRYMAPNASDEEKAVYDYFCKMVQNIQSNRQAGVVMPLAYDPESRQPLFKLELLSNNGGKNYDTDVIIRRYQNDMLTCLHADVLRLGQDQTGSFALSSSKTNVLSMALEYRLKEIKKVLDKQLIERTYEANGWDATELPFFQYEDFDNVDMEEFSKFVQRTAAVGALELDREALNLIRRAIGAKPLAEDVEPRTEYLSPAQSKSGQSLNTPTGGMNGTANSVAGQDNSANNLDNTA